MQNFIHEIAFKNANCGKTAILSRVGVEGRSGGGRVVVVVVVVVGGGGGGDLCQADFKNIIHLHIKLADIGPHFIIVLSYVSNKAIK